MSNKLKTFFFYLGLSIYLIIHVGTSAELHLERNIPWEPDDHYHYIIKAGNIKNCLFETCKGLEDIHVQTNLKLSQHTNLERFKAIQEREKHHFLLSYHPLYSAIMAILNLKGMSFETAQLYMDVVGSIILGTGIAYFVAMLFGKGAAAVTLIYLSVLYFPSWGTHYMSSFNFANALAFWVWGIIIDRKKYKYFGITVLSVLSMAFHPLGVILTSMSFTALFFSQENKLNKYFWINFFIISVISLIFLNYNLKFVNDDVKLLSTYVNYDFIKIIKNNLAVAFYLYSQFLINILPLSLALLIIISLAIFSKNMRGRLKLFCSEWYTQQSYNRRINLKIFSFVFLFAFIVSFFSISEVGLFYRFNIVFIVFIMGIVAAISLFIIMKKIDYHNITTIKGFYKNTVSFFGSLSYDKKFITFIILTLSIIVIPYNGVILLRANRLKISDHNLTFSINQVKKLLNISTGEDLILYNMNSNFNERTNPNSKYNNDELIQNTGAEAAAYFYMAYGASRLHAAISHLYLNTEYKNTIFREPSYLVTLSPTTVPFGGDMFLEEGEIIKINNLGNDFLHNVKIYVENRVSNMRLISVVNSNQEIFIKSDTSGWISIPNDFVNNQSIILSISRISNPLFNVDNLFSMYKSIFKTDDLFNKRIRIRGIRIDSQISWWPWDKNLKIIMDKNRFNQKIILDFNTSVLSPTKDCHVKDIIDDRGSTVLSSLKCDKRN